MSVLEDLYSGKIYPSEIIVPRDEEYKPINRKIGEMREYFSGRLSPEDKEKFEQLSNLIHESIYMESYANFSYGFRLGVMLMTDVMTGYEEPEE